MQVSSTQVTSDSTQVTSDATTSAQTADLVVAEQAEALDSAQLRKLASLSVIEQAAASVSALFSSAEAFNFAVSEVAAGLDSANAQKLARQAVAESARAVLQVLASKLAALQATEAGVASVQVILADRLVFDFTAIELAGVDVVAEVQKLAQLVAQESATATESATLGIEPFIIRTVFAPADIRSVYRISAPSTY